MVSRCRHHPGGGVDCAAEVGEPVRSLRGVPAHAGLLGGSGGPRTASASDSRGASAGEFSVHISIGETISNQYF